MSSTTSPFSLLPPVPLRHDEEGNIESLDHYLSRISGDLGLTPRSISRMLSTAGITGIGTFHGLEKRSAISGLGPRTGAYVAGLSEATGQPDLFRGTFLHLAPALSDVGFANCRSSISWRKWCPRCYLDWDSEKSFEPLVWSFGALSACPAHGCELVTRCHNCGARQPHRTVYSTRRLCSSCGRPLGEQAHRIDINNYDAWVNRQCVLTAQAASVPLMPIPSDTFDRYFARVLDRWAEGETIPGYVRASMSYLLDRWKRGERHLRPTFTQYLNFASFHGTSVEEILLSPESAAAEPLVLGVSSSFALARSRRPRKEAIERVRLAMEKLLASDISHLPSAAAIADAFDVDARYVRERIPDVVANYVEACNRDGRRCTKQELRRAFCFAVAAIREPGFEHSSYELDSLASSVARESASSDDAARCASAAALIALSGY